MRKIKVMTILGTRPEIIRLSRVVKELDRFCRHVLVHTGQNYDPGLSDVFFQELELRPPDAYLGVKAATFAEQAGQVLIRVGEALRNHKPDRVLILGDTNSALSAIVAARMGIAVFHMEAGNRCFDDRVPEEINRRLVDHASRVLLPYTQRSKENLLREGIERERIFVVGNPIFEVLQAHNAQVEASDVLERLGVEAGRYLLATMHRAENVDELRRLSSLLTALSQVAEDLCSEVLAPIHPRTASRLSAAALTPSSQRVRLLGPLGFFDFVKLERHARLVLSDSGTVQEECAIFRVPTVTIRDVTERPETLECGSNVLSGARPDNVVAAARLALDLPTDWQPPAEYLFPHVSRTVTKVVLGHTSIRRHLSDAWAAD